MISLIKALFQAIGKTVRQCFIALCKFIYLYPESEPLRLIFWQISYTAGCFFQMTCLPKRHSARLPVGYCWCRYYLLITVSRSLYWTSFWQWQMLCAILWSIIFTILEVSESHILTRCVYLDNMKENSIK